MFSGGIIIGGIYGTERQESDKDKTKGKKAEKEAETQGKGAGSEGFLLREALYRASGKECRCEGMIYSDERIRIKKDDPGTVAQE
jgi:hypothetical protein